MSLWSSHFQTRGARRTGRRDPAEACQSPLGDAAGEQARRACGRRLIGASGRGGVSIARHGTSPFYFPDGEATADQGKPLSPKQGRLSQIAAGTNTKSDRVQHVVKLEDFTEEEVALFPWGPAMLSVSLLRRNGAANCCCSALFRSVLTSPNVAPMVTWNNGEQHYGATEIHGCEGPRSRAAGLVNQLPAPFADGHKRKTGTQDAQRSGNYRRRRGRASRCRDECASVGFSMVERDQAGGG